jgi:pre-rRNA-processing protein TSR1
MLRTITSLRPKPMIWRDQHSYLVAENIEHILSTDNTSDPSLGVLKVAGFVRGASLSANRLVYLQNHGAFKIQKITSCPFDRHGENEPVVLQLPNPEAQVSRMLCV